MEYEKKDIIHINTNYLESTLYDNMYQYFLKREVCNKFYFPTVDKEYKNINKQYIDISNILNKYDRYRYFYRNKKIVNDFKDRYKCKNIKCTISYSLFSNGLVSYSLYTKYGIEYIVIVQNTDLNVYFKYFLHLRDTARKILLNAKGIIFISESYKNIVEEKYIPTEEKGRFNEKSYIIPFAIDKFWIENKNYKIVEEKRNNKIKLLFVGKVNKNKNIIKIIETCNILINRGYSVTLEIVGEIIDDKIHGIIDKVDYIKYTKFCDKVDLIKIYRRNDIFIMPSIKESFGLVYAEAMSQGLPVIYTKNQGFDKHFEDGIIGYGVNPTNENEISDKIILILDKYKDISKRCTELVDKFEWNRIVKSYYEIIDNIL